MDFELHVVKGRSTSTALKLVDGVNVVGRQDDCTIRIKSSQVSRKHCELFEKKGMLLVKDLKSANGTFVNGKKVDGQQVLEPGDELTIGSIRLRVAKVGEPPVQKEAAGAKSSDTAVAEAVAVSGDEVEFEIDFDDEPAATAADVDDAIEIDFDDEPAPPPAASTPPPPSPPAAPSATAPAKAKEPEPKKAPEPEPSPAAEMADEAIADFLLDIKIDDED